MAAASSVNDVACDVVAGVGFQPDVVVKVEGSTFRARSDLLRMFSACAHGMPEPLTEWDLSALTIFDGKPPSAKVVAAWLEALYWHPESPNTPKTLQDAIPVLLFADAVGSPQRMMHMIASGVQEEWSLRVLKTGFPWSAGASSSAAVDDDNVITLPLVGGDVYVLHKEAGTHVSGNMWYRLCRVNPHAYAKAGHTIIGLKIGVDYHIVASGSREQYHEWVQQLAKQLEELLCLAHRLHISKLALALQAFIRQQRTKGGDDGILGGDKIDRVATKRVRNVLDRDVSGEVWLKWLTGDDTRRE
jgi:hypothetical protein